METRLKNIALHHPREGFLSIPQLAHGQPEEEPQLGQWQHATLRDRARARVSATGDIRESESTDTYVDLFDIDTLPYGHPQPSTAPVGRARRDTQT